MPLTSFASKEYWDKRFTSNSGVFEWLGKPEVLEPCFVEALKVAKDEKPKVLHIGCGTSLLSSNLRAYVQDPETIHNLDYSSVAINIGRGKEVDLYSIDRPPEDRETRLKAPASRDVSIDYDTSGPNTPRRRSSDSRQKGPVPKYMRWSAADLLDPNSLFKVCEPEAYSVILDKSTSDSIACCEDIRISLPYRFSTHMVSSISTNSYGQKTLPPVDALALHLAVVARPGARWVALSYSNDRFPFVENSILDSQGAANDQVVDSVEPPHPGTLWKLLDKYEVEVPPQEAVDETTHRPKIMHWMYTLERTNIPLFLNDS